MKKIIFGLNLILLLSVFCFAQKQKTSPEPADGDTQKKQSNKKSEQNGDVLLQTGTSIEAQLQQTLDIKNASVGDRVVLKTTKTIKQNGQTVVQKGSRLIGRVTEVQQKTKGTAQSKLGVIFDRIEGKNLSAPISVAIVSMTQANANTALGDTADSDISGNSNTSAKGSRTNSSGGGLLGGVTNTVGGVVNTTTNTVGGVTNTTGQTLGTTLNGIQLSQSSSTSANGATTLSSQSKNLRLEKGIMFQLRLTESVEN